MFKEVFIFAASKDVVTSVFIYLHIILSNSDVGITW